jgi:hypothetical protein
MGDGFADATVGEEARAQMRVQLRVIRAHLETTFELIGGFAMAAQTKRDDG